MTALSVNINKFALVRNARGANMPDIINISEKCLLYGADGITVHPRPDERHAKFSDLLPLKKLISKYENNIVIIDSFGKLDQYFKISDLVILGGSFLKNIGGHNPIEPASYGCAIISGNYVDNWTNIYEDMVKANSCIILNRFEDIDMKMKELLNNNLKIKKIQANAIEFSNKSFFEREKLFQNIEKYIN